MDDGLLQPNGTDAHVNGLDQDVLEDGELDDQEQQPTVTHSDRSHEHEEASSKQPQELHQAIDTSANGDMLEAPGMPHAAIGGVQDEALKNLMMSWYYAGYYTGLYEGKQEPKQQAPG
ncbi:MAG: hypothetical protein M1830_005141 [Pleopsidium flavum]|nr:MAG: hypothetical protein M1830_005141 [Pleopsidium flavum]